MKSSRPLSGVLRVPGDKSMSHRSVMLSSLAKGTTTIKGFLMGEDCKSTIRCFRDMGVKIDVQNDLVIVHGKGLYGLSKPHKTLYVGNSGTTIRIMSGILCAQRFSTVVTGDRSIEKRPMRRIMTPLSMMGADIKGTKNGTAPLRINPAKLKGIEYNSPVASAQVKSSILMANLYTGETSTIVEPTLSRNHTELMLNHFGGNVTISGHTITSKKIDNLFANDIYIPADISSAAFFIVAASIVEGSELLLKDVSINETRAGIIKVMKQMNANIEIMNERITGGEKIADILVRYSKLKATTINGDIIPTLIDEIPIIAVAALFAEGTTIIADAAEAKVKETNRLSAVTKELNKLGATITETDDGLIIEGNTTLHGGNVESYDDHRMAMSLTIASLIAGGEVTIKNKDCVKISYPTFYDDLKQTLS